jgi:hypothetical protein
MALLLSLLFQPVYKSWKREKVREPEGDSKTGKALDSLLQLIPAFPFSFLSGWDQWRES